MSEGGRRFYKQGGDGSYGLLNAKYNQLLALLEANGGGGGPTTSGLATILANGNNAGGLDIANLDNLQVNTINSAPYPPTASTATNLAGGVASQIPFQSAPNTTGFIANGVSGQYLKSNGAGTPSWATIPVIPATPTITQVLTAGYNALDVTQTFSATGSPTTTNIDDAEVQIIDGTSGINSKLEYDRLTVTGNYAPYNTTNVVSNTGMVINTTDNSNPYQYSTTANYATINQFKQNTSTFFSESAVMSAVVGLYHETNDSSGSGDITKLSLKASSTDGTIRCYNSGTPSALAPLDFQASALTLNGNPLPAPPLFDVLSVGNNAYGLNIAGVNNIDVSTINSNPYPPSVTTPSLGDVMTVNNVATNNLNMANYDITNVNTINGLSPVVLGLNWGDFTGSNAYANLPNQAYQVYSGGQSTSQYYDRFESYNGSNYYGRLFPASLEFYDMGSSTTTSYTSNSIQSTNGTDFTITAGSGASTALRLDCSQLIINGVAYSVPPPPPLRWGYYQNSGVSFSMGSGFQNVGVSSSPIQTLSGMTPSGSYTIAIQFNCWVNSADTTSSCYLGYSNSSGSFTGNNLYDSGTPCPNTTAVGVYPYGSSTQFTIQDTLIFVAGSSGELYLDLFFGSSVGWSGIYKWSLSAQIVSP